MDTMSKEAREARNAYLRNWNRANKDKRKTYNARYWEKKAQTEKDGKKTEEIGNKGGTG